MPDSFIDSYTGDELSIPVDATNYDGVKLSMGPPDRDEDGQQQRCPNFSTTCTTLNCSGNRPTQVIPVLMAVELEA